MFASQDPINSCERMFRSKTTIDKSVELLIDDEREHWRHVLTRIIAIVKRLAKNTLPFRGDDERLHVENNDLFLQMVEMVSESDLVMQEPLRRAKAREIQYTYLGKKIQNELIQLLANQKKVDDTTGFGLATELRKAFIKIDLDIDDIRRQGYNNEANMSGKHKESNEDPKVKSKVESLATHELQNFEFLFGMIIWYRLLHAVNIVSKFHQTESMDINHAIDLLQGLVSFLEEYREIGFAIAKDEATKKASEIGIEAIFTEKRIIRRKNNLMEAVVMRFLFNLKRLRGATFSSLLISCLNLEKYLQHNGHLDISGDDLCLELQVLMCSIPSELHLRKEVSRN
ncbi:uncharacterized protein LOC111388585 [Olea europaea var. sylvestris]|uniref:uncharacterized protein LOC111388585 n=1 Tax=Olea europaea var. sylvestris TaxID=158386 RepID=UPI000C1D769B|nr:uncharacterized protein LOC111388585 [Olea europaea var. sylvestris]